MHTILNTVGRGISHADCLGSVETAILHMEGLSRNDQLFKFLTKGCNVTGVNSVSPINYLKVLLEYKCNNRIFLYVSSIKVKLIF